MDVSFKKRYASESEFLYDLAQSSPYFRSEDFKAFSEIEQADVYTSTIIATRDKVSNTFDTKEYDLLAGQDRLSYLYNEYLQDKTETAVDEKTGETYNVYERNKQYLNARLDEAIDAKTFDSLNGFEKVMHTIGGVVGNALNTLFFGAAEGLLDVLSLGLGSFAAQIGWTEATDAITKFIAQDTTGYQKNQEALQRYARAYTYIDKSGFVSAINDVVSGITQMAPMLIPGVGTAIYFGGMAGNIAEEAVRANPDINYWALMGYTAAVGAVEGLTEKISSGIFGGSAIDNLMFKSSKNVLGGWASRIGFNFASEGFEEAVSEFADSVLYTAMVDPNAPLATIEEILYAGLIGGLIGGITGAIEISTVEKLTINGKQLTKLETLAYQGQLQNAIELTKKSAVDSLMVKYSNLNIEQIKTQHAQEYQNAVEKDNNTTRKLAEATIALAKLVEIAGVEKIQKASDLVNYQIESYANLMKNYVAHATSNIAANRAVEEKFATKNPGQSITINDVLTENQRKIKQELKSAYGIDAYFGNLGARDGLIKNNGLTLDEKTIVIDDRLFNEMSLDQIMTTVVKEELVHTLQFDEGRLTKETLNKLRESYTQQGGKIQEGGDLDLAYSRSSALTKQAELEAKAICQMLLFDEITISRVFSTNTNVFFKVFNTLKNLKKNIESKKTKRTNKDKVRFREILQAMGRYEKAAANNIGNEQDANTVADKMDLDDAGRQRIKDAMLLTYDTEHFTQLMESFTMSVTKHKEATNLLLRKRKDNSIFFPKLDYSKVFDENYYTADFVQEIKNRNPEQDFRYNLQEAMINDFGFTINDKAGALMEVIDLTKMTTKEFMYDITNLAINSSRIDKYTNLAQIFEPDFVRKFDSPFGNELAAIKINVVKTDNDTSAKASYNHLKGVITINLNANKLTNFSESDALKHSILHETVHALSAIQNLAWGTSSKYIRSGLNVLPTKTINSLAEKLLTKEFYEQNKGKLDVLLDNIAYGIYRITDSEYTAEAYKTSKWRKNDIELKLKAGATMNRSGFYISDFGKLSGYGRFAGIEIKLGGEQLVSQENVKSKNLQDATEVVAYSRVSTIGEFIKNKGYKDFESAGFSEDAIKVFSDPYKTYEDVGELIESNNIGTPEATQLIIDWYIANKPSQFKNENKHMKTMKDLDLAISIGLEYAIAYRNYVKDNNLPDDRTKPHTLDEIMNIVLSNPEIEARVSDKIQKLQRKKKSDIDKSTGTDGDEFKLKYGSHRWVEEQLFKDNNKRIKTYLLKTDFDYSLKATTKLMKDLTGREGLGGLLVESETSTISKKDSSNEVNQIDQQIGKEYAESEGFGDPAKLLEGLEDDRVSENKFKNLTVDEFITALGIRIKELSNSPKYFTLEKNITDSSKKVNKTLKLVYGEDGFKKIKDYVQSNMSSREKFNKQRKRRIEKISKIPNLSATAKQKVAQPYATFSPTQYEKYISFLDKLIETNEKRQAQKAEPVVEEVKQEAITETVETSEPLVKKEEVILDDTITTQEQSTHEIKGEEQEIQLESVIEPTQKNTTPVVQIQESESIPAVDKIENVAKEIDNIQNIDSKEPSTITKTILDKYKHATTDISEAQFFDDTDMVYQTVGEEIFNDLLPVFAAINEDNYQTIRDELKESKEFYADQALVLFDMYTLECEGRFSQETQNKIRAYNRRELTKAAQRLNRQAKRVLEKKGVTDLVRSFKANGIDVTVTDNMVGEIFPELADKEKRIEELEQQIKELNNELKSMQDLSQVVVSLTNQIEELKSQQEKATQDSEEYKKLQNKIDELTEEVAEKQAKLATTEDLYAKLKEASQEALILKNGSNEDIVDFFIQKLEEKGIVGSEKAAQKLKDLLEKLVLSGRINKTGESLDFYTIDKDGKPKAFPKLVKVLEAANSFRMWAMLSSPVTYVRNWMGNLGMKGLEAATNFMSRHIEKELSDEKFNELDTKKKAAVEQAKKAKSVVNDADKNITEYKKQLANKELSEQEKQEIQDKIDDVSGQKDVAETQLTDLETEIKGYEFQQDQFNIASKKATEETTATVEKLFSHQIEGLVSGTVKYAKEDERTQQAITTKTEALELKAKEGTWWERTKAKAELYELKGLETGWFGDRRIVISSLKKNFANMLESNKAKFLRDLRNEKTRLESKKELSEKDRDKLNLIDKALQSERMEDIVQAVPQAHIELLLDKALTITQKQYFKNSNALSRLLYNVGRKNPMLGTVVSFILPFPKVAYNILATAIDYSPLGFLKALAQGSVIKQMEKGDYKNMSGFEKAERAQTISKASVGTMMFIAGAIAAALGWVDVEEDDYLGVSLHINLGADVRISLSNLAPSMTTFSASAAMIWAFKEGKGFNGAMKQILSTLYDNTLLGNVENIFAYGSLENWASNASISWISQYIPAIVKLVTKTIDPRKKDKSGNYWNKLIKTLGSYLPGVSTLVPSKIDPYTGQEVYNTGTSNWFLNFIAGVSPLDIDLANNYKTNLQLEAERLGAETTGLSGKFTINGKDFVVSDKEKYSKYRANYINTQYQKIVSGKEKVTIEDENGKRKTTTYDKLTNEQKKNVLNRLYSDATSKTKIKAWVEEGNYYYTSNRDEYNELRKLLNNNKIIYRSSWSKSKFVSK